MDINNRYNRLKKILRGLRSVLVAYSGGVDSTFLLKIAFDVLGQDNVLAVTADSPTYSRFELRFAKKMAGIIGARHKVIRTKELDKPKFSQNPVDRCYYCKLELFSKLKEIAKDERLNFVIDASNASDLSDFRPGSQARKELGVRAPLQEAGFTKEEIRVFSRKMDLQSWNAPQLACLASRFPYGERITREKLRRVEHAEAILKKMGFDQVRVRSYDGLCRIEVDKERIPRFLKIHNKNLVTDLKRLGYKYVTLDLEGYRSGSMNI